MIQKILAFLSALRARLALFFHHPWQSCKAALRQLWLLFVDILAAMWEFAKHAVGYIPLPIWRRAAIVTASVVALVFVAYSAVMIYVENAIAIVPPPERIHYLASQNWGTFANSNERQDFYHLPQGSYLRGIRYEWLQNLERPWSTERFADGKYMRSYGFLLDERRLHGNEAMLPVGFASRYDADTGEMMVDLTCAFCHTGQLEISIDGATHAVRIDGGSGGMDLFTTSPGYFAGDLAASMIATAVNPFKWYRFRKNVLGSHDTPEARRLLETNYRQVLWSTLSQSFRESRLGVYPVQEGYGRTDGLGRIMNNAFAVNLAEENYRVANAPVSYPHIWDIWKFDWVQYMASVRQPMARNTGETLGTGARYFLHDPYGKPVHRMERFNATILFANLQKLESSLHKLHPPCWPQELFGQIDIDKAMEGRKLFLQHCDGCHGVRNAPINVIQLEAPGKLPSQRSEKANFGGAQPQDKPLPHWVMKGVSLEEIGTDPQSALNFINNRVDLSKTGLKPEDIEAAMAPYYQEQYKRLVAFCQQVIVGQQANNQMDSRCVGIPTNGKVDPEAEQNYVRANVGSVQIPAVAPGAALNYLIKMMRDQAYSDMGITDQKMKANWDGFGQLDIPQVLPQYKARPLAGIWATPPFLHNGSVPTIYDLLSPVYARPNKFYRKGHAFDPVRLGLVVANAEKQAMLFDTTVVGNSNVGHEFRAGYKPWSPGKPPQNGIIGPELTEREKLALLEYLKVHRDDENAACEIMIPPNGVSKAPAKLANRTVAVASTRPGQFSQATLPVAKFSPNVAELGGR